MSEMGPPGGERAPGVPEGDRGVAPAEVQLYDDAPAAGGPGATSGRGSRRRAARQRRRRLVLGIVAAVVVLILAVVAWYEIEAHPRGAPGKTVVLSVHEGESTSSVVSALVDGKVIDSSLAFRIFLFVHGTPLIEPGDYAMRQNSSFASVHQLLAGGPNTYSLAIPAGFTLAEVANRIGTIPGHHPQSFYKDATDGSVTSPWLPAGSTNLEGLVGSGTYLVLPGESNVTLLTQMVAEFNRQAAAAGLTTTSATALGLSPYQVIIAASIVEKEGYVEKNMPDVARVIYNRLAKGTALQMDSTILYSLGQDGGTVTKADLAKDTPYNTYLHTGLTPTPICIPSQTALAAAVSPPPGDWLFFEVVSKDGTEAFSSTFSGQLANEALAQSRGLG